MTLQLFVKVLKMFFVHSKAQHQVYYFSGIIDFQLFSGFFIHHTENTNLYRYKNVCGGLLKLTG